MKVLNIFSNFVTLIPKAVSLLITIKYSNLFLLDMFNRNTTPFAILLLLTLVSSCNRYSYPIQSAVTESDDIDIQALLGGQNEELAEVEVEQDTALLAYVDQVEMNYDEVEDYYDFLPFTDYESKNVRLSEYSKIDVNDLQILLKDSDSSAFHYPTDEKVGFVTSPYGWRSGRMHSGIDLKVYQGDNIYSAFDGVVRLVQYQRSGWGYHIVIRHYNGLETLYSHCSKLLVEVNQKVKAGDLIGLGGRTGRATGTHLHFEVRVAGETINPALILDTDNKTHSNKNLYITKRSGKIYASNNDDKAAREAEILSTLSIKYHVVKSGDVLGRIASRYGSSVSTICRLNGIKSSTTLRIGQRLVVRDGISVEEIKRRLENQEQEMTKSTTAQDIYGSKMIVKTGKEAQAARESQEMVEQLKQEQAQLLAQQAELKRIEDEKIAKTTTYYTVRKGDMLSTIASRNGTTVSNLCTLNAITTRTKLQIGQKLIVSKVASPSGVEQVVDSKVESTEILAKESVSAPKSTATPKQDNTPTTNYTIQSGDVLGTIAEKNNTTVSMLCSLNGISSKTTLRVGRTLKVPANGNNGVSQSEQISNEVKNEVTREYTIKSGDMLSSIAMKHNTSVSAICNLNGISTSTKLQIGQKLSIPTSQTVSSNEKVEYYVVKSGDVLGRIAEKNNTTVSKICSLNGITSKTTLKIGQKLRIR